MALKRKGDEEDDDVTSIPWDGQYGPEPPKEMPEGGSGGMGVGAVKGVVQWSQDDGAVGAGAAGTSISADDGRPKFVVRAVMSGGGGSG